MMIQNVVVVAVVAAAAASTDDNNFDPVSWTFGRNSHHLGRAPSTFRHRARK
jgi:hypothetical protein